MLGHVPSFGRNPRGSPDFLAYPVSKACMHVLGTGVPRCLGVARFASSPKAAQALGCSLTPGLRIPFGRVTCMARAASVPGLWTLGFLLLRGACVWVWVVVGFGFQLRPALLPGVLGCVCACVCALLAPSHSWHGCAVWVCVFGLGFGLRPATPGWGVGLCACSACTQPLLATGARCACVCLGSGFGCAPPFLAGVLGCVRALLAPSHSWPRVRGVGVCVWARVSAVPRHSWLGCWAVCVLRLHPATPGHGCALWVCVFGLGFGLRPATPGWGVGLYVCSACTQPLLATGARCGCVCLGSGFRCAPPLLAPVWGCVRGPLAPSHSWPQVRGVGVCVWARVSAAPRHSWQGCWAVCVLRLHPATPGHGCAVWVCVFGLGFWLRPTTPGWGDGLCVCSACTLLLLARVRGVGVCVCTRVPAAPCHSWLGCWAVCVLRLHPATPGHGCAVWVCVFGLGLRLRPATPGWGVGLCACSACTQPLLATGARCGCVCLGSGFGCAPPLLAGVLGCVCAPLAPSLSWPRLRGVGVCVWARVSAAPRHSWQGCWAVCVLRLHPATHGHACAVWVCVFGLRFRLRPATSGWGVGLCVCSACTQPLLVSGSPTLNFCAVELGADF